MCEWFTSEGILLQLTKILSQVAHFAEVRPAGHLSHTTPNWKLLTPEETLGIKRLEASKCDPADGDEAWSCNHCATHLDNWAKREPVIAHLGSA